MTDTATQQLWTAARNGVLSEVEAALAAGAAADARGEYGDTALNLAAEGGYLELVQRLCAAGADLENVGGSAKTPLMNAAFAGRARVVEYLLGQGARVTDDLLSSMQAKVNIFRDQAEDGWVRPESVDAWQQFLDYLVEARRRQDEPSPA